MWWVGYGTNQSYYAQFYETHSTSFKVTYNGDCIYDPTSAKYYNQDYLVASKISLLDSF